MIEDYDDEITDPRWRNALTFGLILAVVNAASNLIVGWTMSASPGGGLLSATSPSALLASGGLGCLTFLIQLGLLFAAGMMTARISGSVRGASWTGLVAGLIGGFFGSFTTLVIYYLLIMPSILVPAGLNVTADELQSAIMLELIIVGVISIVIDGGIGAGVAALGGLVGRAGYDADEAEAETQLGAYQGPRGAAPPKAYAPPQFPTDVQQYQPHSDQPMYTSRAMQYEPQTPLFPTQRDSGENQPSYPPFPPALPPDE